MEAILRHNELRDFTILKFCADVCIEPTLHAASLRGVTDLCNCKHLLHLCMVLSTSGGLSGACVL